MYNIAPTTDATIATDIFEVAAKILKCPRKILTYYIKFLILPKNLLTTLSRLCPGLSARDNWPAQGHHRPAELAQNYKSKKFKKPIPNIRVHHLMYCSPDIFRSHLDDAIACMY